MESDLNIVLQRLAEISIVRPALRPYKLLPVTPYNTRDVGPHIISYSVSGTGQCWADCQIRHRILGVRGKPVYLY